MFLIRFLRSIFGYVTFSTIGGNPERFLNQCAFRQISLWNIRTLNGELTACMRLREYRRIRPTARKARTRLSVKSRHGLPFTLHRYRFRAGIIVGLALFFAVLFLLSQRVWTIGVTGCKTVSPEYVLRSAADLGLEAGAKKSGIDVSELQKRCLLKMPELSWIAVNIRGSHAAIEVKERIVPPQILDEKIPCNVKSLHAGQIVSMEVYSGQAMVRQGDAVTEGQLLVSGIFEDKYGATNFTHARAKIMAATTRELTQEVPFEQSEQVLTGKTVDKNRLLLFGLRIPLYLQEFPDGDYLSEVASRPLCVGGFELPIGFEKTRYYEFERKTEQITAEQALERAREMLEKREKEELSGVEIRGRSEEVEQTETGITVKIVYDCYENIGFEEEILLN